MKLLGAMKSHAALKGGDLGKGGAKGAQEKRAGCSDERL